MTSRVGWNPTVRSRLEKFRFALFVSVPIVVGFGLGRYYEFWEFVEEWTRSAAANPKGPYLPKELTEHRPTLQSEYSKLILEQALDAALEEARKAKSERVAKQA